MIKAWIQKGAEIGEHHPIVFFERLKAKPRQVLTEILTYLKVPIDRKRLDCAVKTEPLLSKRKEIPLFEKIRVHRAFSRNSGLKSFLVNEIKEINRLLKSTGRKERISYVQPTY